MDTCASEGKLLLSQNLYVILLPLEFIYSVCLYFCHYY